MSENQNWNSIGEELKSALSEALQSGNFKNLNDLVVQTVSETIREATAQIPVWKRRALERERKRRAAQQEQLQEFFRKKLSSDHINKVGGVSGILYQVFGGIGLGISTLSAFERLFDTLSGHGTLAGWVVNLVFLAFFFGMIRFGIAQKMRLRRADRYLALCDYGVYGEITKLADGIGKGEKYVVRDLQKMLELGIFPEGHLDKQKTCFMLNDAVYRQYLETENNRKLRGEENRKVLQENKASQMEQPAPEQKEAKGRTSELRAMEMEGAEYIRRLRDLNDEIPGEIISAKLFCLENLLRDIFDSVRIHPEQMPHMHKLMNYYLPTTIKLVESYETFDKIGSPGPDIVKAKAEIENTIDTINAAFRELLNNLFQDAVFDATTDAQVLKSMLAREGLTREMAFAKTGQDDPKTEGSSNT